MRLLFGCVAALALAVSACSSDDGAGGPNGPGTPEKPGPVIELNQVGALILSYGGENRRGPRGPADLEKYEPGGPIGLQSIKSGEIVVVWGATMAGEGEANAPKGIVAYEKNAPTEGGHVLLQNGQVQKMTAEQFKAAPKAK